jgi:hypothetical protein
MPWNNKVVEVSKGHASVTGLLAGFSITIVVLLVTLGPLPGNEKIWNFLNPVTVATFLVSFMGYIAATVIYAVVIQAEGAHESILHSLASSIFFYAGVLAFVGLYPLVHIARVDALTTIPAFTLVGVVVGGYLAAATPYHDLLSLKSKHILVTIPFLGLLTALLIDQYSGREVIHLALNSGCVLVALIFLFCMLSFFVTAIRKERVFIVVAWAVLYGSAVLAFSTTYSMYKFVDRVMM